MVQMKRKLAISGSALLVLTCLAFASVPVSAAETIIEPGTSFSQSVSITSDHSAIIFSWSASHSVLFSITDPDGVSIYSFTGMSRTAARDVSQMGTYTLHWSNMGGTAVSLTYSVTPASISLGGIGALIAVAIIVVATVIVVIVIVIVFLVRRPQSGRPGYVPYPPPTGMPGYPPPSWQVPPQPMPSQMYGPQYVGPVREGRCPRCGSVVVPNALFCSRCGARFS